MSLSSYFSHFREHIVGQHTTFETPFGQQSLLYADWIASGRLYGPIEERLYRELGPFVGNTHTETTVTGTGMTMAYHHAQHIIKQHVGADPKDVLISSNSGMTGVVNKFQRILGIKLHERFQDQVVLSEEERPVVFITHMEHHSNQTSWMETIADIEIIQPTSEGLVDLEHFDVLLEKYAHRPIKFAAVTSCSNVTGIFTPYHEIARRIHAYGGWCFVDFACSAPYIDINMHPENKEERLDAIYFSPHKFLGGPGGTGILIFNPLLYKNKIPDNPGGGTVDWTNPWGGHKYTENIEAREDGGTPAFLQTIKAAYAIQLKEEMGVEQIRAREEELLSLIWPRLQAIPKLNVLAPHVRERLGALSFYIDDLHYNLVVRLLNDRYGIQTRGGCSCAGTYGHYLLHVTPEHSNSITQKINDGDLSQKPGWVRLSVHPTMTDEEAILVCDALEAISLHGQTWAKEYDYHVSTNEFHHKNDQSWDSKRIEYWFRPLNQSQPLLKLD